MRHPKQTISISDSIALVVTKLKGNQYKVNQTLPIYEHPPHLRKDYSTEIIIQVELLTLKPEKKKRAPKIKAKVKRKVSKIKK